MLIYLSFYRAENKNCIHIHTGHSYNSGRGKPNVIDSIDNYIVIMSESHGSCTSKRIITYRFSDKCVQISFVDGMVDENPFTACLYT